MRRDLGDGYELDDARDRVDVDAVHACLTASYWALGRSREDVAAMLGSAWRVVGLYHADAQVGYARAVSDGLTIAYLADVYVLEEHRGHGRGEAIVRQLVDDAAGRQLSWLLHTRDAHTLYARLGFTGPSVRVMERWGDGS